MMELQQVETLSAALPPEFAQVRLRPPAGAGRWRWQRMGQCPAHMGQCPAHMGQCPAHKPGPTHPHVPTPPAQVDILVNNAGLALGVAAVQDNLLEVR
jgi:hypothetical protein